MGEIMKKTIQVYIKSNDNISEAFYSAINYNNKIIYNEKNCKTTILFKENCKIIRENEEYIMNLLFIPNKITECEYLLKKTNNIIELKILTDYLIIDNNIIKLRYKVLTTDQEVVFQIKM